MTAPAPRNPGGGNPASKPRSYTVGESQKVTPFMFYTQSMFGWGDVVTMEAVRVSTWLRTPASPQYIALHDAHVLTVGGGGNARPQSFAELHVPVSVVIGYHIVPPHRDPLDYDQNEPHRKMEPMTALVGAFRFDGFIRMSTQTDLARYLDTTKEKYTSIYDVEITHPTMPSIGVIRTPYVLLLRDMVIFSTREVK